MKYRIEQDFDAMNPREQFDNLGTMVCFHRRYQLGDDNHGYDQADYESWGEVRKAIQEEEDAAVILPLFMMDHSGLTIRCESASFRACDSAGWDWGQIGFIFVSKEALRREFNKQRISATLIDRATEILRAEVEAYSAFVSGDVYGFIIEDDRGERVSSCWGFYGCEDCEREAKKEQLEYEEKQRAKEPPSYVPAPACCSF